MIDTGRLFKPILIMFVVTSLIRYPATVANPLWGVIIILYGVIIWSFNDVAKYRQLVYLGIIGDILMIISLQFLHIIVYIPMFTFWVLLITNNFVVGKELDFFNRTVQSLNDDDKKKARKALKTEDIEDIVEVAEYTDWSTIT